MAEFWCIPRKQRCANLNWWIIIILKFISIIFSGIWSLELRIMFYCLGYSRISEVTPKVNKKDESRF